MKPFLPERVTKHRLPHERTLQHPESKVLDPPSSADSVVLSKKTYLLFLASLTVLAGIVRIIATHNDLWLDEIILVQIAKALTA